MIDVNVMQDNILDISNKIFDNELTEKVNFRELIYKEVKNRSHLHKTSKDYKVIVNDFIQKITDELEAYEDIELIKRLKSFSNIDKNFISEFETNKDKRPINLYIQYLKYSGKKINSNTIKDCDWYEPIYYTLIEWKCSFCKTSNAIKYTNRTHKDINQYKCKNCTLCVSNDYDRDMFSRQYRYPITLKDFLAKVKELQNELDKYYQEIDAYEINDSSWSIQDKYLEYETNKHKLPLEIRQFFKLYNGLPDKKDLTKDYEKVRTYININEEKLIEYGVMKKITRKPTEHELMLKLTNYLKIEMYVDEGFGYPSFYTLPICELFNTINKSQFKEEYKIFLKDIKFENTNSIYTVSHEIPKEIYIGKKLNEYFFNDLSVGEIVEKSNIENEIIQNLFQSKAEFRTYHHLKYKHKNDNVQVNKLVSRIINFDNKILKEFFSKEDINYLKKAFFNYMIFDNEGKLQKVYELQLGIHHKGEEYHQRDNLKSKLCDLLSIDYEELF